MDAEGRLQPPARLGWCWCWWGQVASRPGKFAACPAKLGPGEPDSLTSRFCPGQLRVMLEENKGVRVSPYRAELVRFPVLQLRLRRRGCGRGHNQTHRESERLDDASFVGREDSRSPVRSQGPVE